MSRPVSLPSALWRWVCLGGLLLGWASAASAAAPGEEFILAVPGAAGPMQLRFRFCPAGMLTPGNPIANAKPVPIRPFYMGETEVTIAQFRLLMGDKALAPMKLLAQKQAEKNPDLKWMVDAFDNPNSQHPLFFADLSDAVNFCKKLQERFDEERRKSPTPSVETRRFRLPSHYQWQYAARAGTTLPHFNTTVAFAELSVPTQVKCKEVWLALVKPGEVGTTPELLQQQILTMAAEAKDSERPKVNEILVEYYSKLFKTPPRLDAGVGKLLEVGRTRPNAWNIYDMHDNVTEWVVMAADLKAHDQVWSDLVSKGADSAKDKEKLFLAGGCYVDTFNGASKLNKFTLWGGPRLVNNDAAAFKYDPDLTFEYSPGFRLTMERALADDWLLVVRREWFRNGTIAPDARARITQTRKLLDELVAKDDPAYAVVDFYESLVDAYQKGDLIAAADKLEQLKGKLGGGKGLDLDDLFSGVGKPGGTGTKPATGPSDDDLYLQSLSGLLRNTSGPAPKAP